MEREVAHQAAQHTAEAVNAKVSLGMTYGGGATAFIGGLTLNEFAIVFGMVVGLLGFVLQVYQTCHKRKVYVAERKLIEERAQREREEHAAKMGMYQ